jgi:hypothetical protein
MKYFLILAYRLSVVCFSLYLEIFTPLTSSGSLIRWTCRQLGLLSYPQPVPKERELDLGESNDKKKLLTFNF